jgi:mono/diheme cytochrome c family protein
MQSSCIICHGAKGILDQFCMVDPIAAEDDSSAGVKENWTRTKHR